MTDQFHNARWQLDRARERVEAARAALARFEADCDVIEPQQARLLERLQDDVRKAEEDAGWCAIALADTSAPTEVPA